MENFVFSLPTQVFFGKGVIENIANALPKDARVLFLYGGGSIKQNGVYEQVLHALEGYFFIEFGGVEPNPQYTTLVRAMETARKEQCDYILAVGGGSVIDGAKFVAAGVPYTGDPWDLLIGKASVKDPLPIGAVLTLPATGSETNSGSVISRKETGDKLPFSSPLLRPVFACLDPTTTYTLSQRQTANGIIDAFVHVLEQYITYPVDAKIQDRFAESILLTLIEEAPKVFQDPHNYDARANIMWAATMALNGMLSIGVPSDWSSHMIGHELTARFGLDHGVTLAIITPAVLEYKKDTKREKLIQYAQRVWNCTKTGDEAVAFAIQQTRAFFESIHTPTHLKDYAITEDTFQDILQKLQEHTGGHPLGERQDIRIQDVEKILHMAL